jgi:hypothetical protein
MMRIGCTNDTSVRAGGLTDRVVSLYAWKEIDCSIKVVLSYDTIFKLWTEELFCS